MKKNIIIIFVLVIVAVIVIFLSTNSSYEITNFPSAGNSIVAFGDSLVAGVGSEIGGGFVTLMSRKFSEPIINLGVAGDTTQDALLRINSVLESKPKVVLILLGGNDFIRRKDPVETFRNLETIVSKIQETGAITIILGVQGGLIRDKYDDEYRSLARKTGSAYINNVLDGLIRNPEYMFDSIHPNDKGYAIIAQKILPTLEALNTEK